MEIFLNKIKSYFKKEKQQDILYVLATVLIVGIVAVSFVLSVSVVIKAVGAAFFINQKDISEDILKFDFDGFKKIAPRLRIDFETNQSQKVSVPPAPVQAPVVETPTATSTPEIDLSTINLEILNGTATKGLAADWKEKFVAAGFNGEKIETGNALKKDYSGATVFYNSQNNALEKVVKIFEDNNLAVKTEIDDKLNASSFLVIIGK